MKNSKLAVILLGVSVLFASSLFARWDKVSEEGEIIKKEIQLDKFDAIALAIPANVYLTQGSTQKVVIEGEANIINNIERKVKKGSWKISFDKKTRNRNIKQLDIYITIPNLSELLVAGSGNVVTKNTFNNLGDLSISIAGSGNVNFSGEAKNVGISIAGSGDIKMDGTAPSVDISIAGSGDVNLKSFMTQNCNVSIAGSGNCKVNVNGQLDVSIIGSGDVYYEGAAKVKSTVRGSGSVHQM